MATDDLSKTALVFWAIAIFGLHSFTPAYGQTSSSKSSEASATKSTPKSNAKTSAAKTMSSANQEREPTPQECYQRYLVDLCRASEPGQIEVYLSSRLQERWQKLRTEDPATIDKEFRLYKKWMIFQPKFSQQPLAPEENNPNRERILLTISGNTVADEQGKFTNMITGSGTCRMELAKEFGFWKIDCASLTGKRVLHRNSKNWVRTKCCDVK